MAVRIVRLGSPREPGEGVRLGTVRRPPRGVPRSEFASRDFYDAWLPTLAPSAELMAWIKAEEITPARWEQFTRKYKAEMAQGEAPHVVAALAALSRGSEFSVGCYCEDEARCHRSLLRGLLAEAGATMADTA